MAKELRRHARAIRKLRCPAPVRGRHAQLLQGEAFACEGRVDEARAAFARAGQGWRAIRHEPMWHAVNVRRAALGTNDELAEALAGAQNRLRELGVVRPLRFLRAVSLGLQLPNMGLEPFDPSDYSQW